MVIARDGLQSGKMRLPTYAISLKYFRSTQKQTNGNTPLTQRANGCSWRQERKNSRNRKCLWKTFRFSRRVKNIEILFRLTVIFKCHVLLKKQVLSNNDLCLGKKCRSRQVLRIQQHVASSMNEPYIMFTINIDVMNLYLPTYLLTYLSTYLPTLHIIN